jgi:hypothetical protein
MTDSLVLYKTCEIINTNTVDITIIELHEVRNLLLIK